MRGKQGFDGKVEIILRIRLCEWICLIRCALRLIGEKPNRSLVDAQMCMVGDEQLILERQQVQMEVTIVHTLGGDGGLMRRVLLRRRAKREDEGGPPSPPAKDDDAWGTPSAVTFR